MDNPQMDKQIDIEAMRTSLQSMTRAQVLDLAVAAGLKPSTIEKFRLNRIAEPKLSKLQALQRSLAKHKKLAEPAKA